MRPWFLRWKSRPRAVFFKKVLYASVGVCGLLWGADKIWPLPSTEGEFARIVLSDDGTPLWRFPDKNGIWRYPVSIEDVSPLYLQALLGYEDRWFYWHPGLNPMSIVRAAWQNVRNQRIISGGSTISMQVARLIEPHERTMTGKLIEAWRTMQLEWHYSKKEILQIYINRAPFGGAQEGIGAASWSYLDKPPAELTPAEAALLAVLPQSPSRLRPDRYPARAQKARDKVLNRLRSEGVWTADVVNDAKEEQLFLPPRHVPQTAPLLAQRVRSMSPDRVIRTTIDNSLQQRVESLVKNWRQHLPARSSIAVLVVESDTMAVKTYVGSTGLADEDRHGFVDMVTSIRSPGSTLKPFLYALAMDDGLVDSESLLLDVPRQDEQYHPGNFSQGFSGPVSVSEALHRSLNVPAVQLLEAYGPKRFSAIMSSHGLVLQYPHFAAPNLTVILGGAGTTLESLVQSYSAFARNGEIGLLRYFPTQPLETKPLISAGAAWITRLILTGEWLPDQITDWGQSWPLAYKTGTSYGYRDAWAVGVNQRYILGVWIGRPDGTPVAGQFGASTAVPLLREVDSLLSGKNQYGRPPIPMLRPASVSKAVICWPGGERADEVTDGNCRQERKAWVLDQVVPPTLHLLGKPAMSPTSWSVFLDAQGLRVRPECGYATHATYQLWPSALEPWLPPQEWADHRLPVNSATCPVLQNDHDALLRISGIRSGATIHHQAGDPVELHLRATGGAKTIFWFLDKVLVDQSTNNQLVHITLSQVGDHVISVMDDRGNMDRVVLNVQ
jgi:penicillin-binding protein 1C